MSVKYALLPRKNDVLWTAWSGENDSKHLHSLQQGRANSSNVVLRVATSCADVKRILTQACKKSSMPAPRQIPTKGMVLPAKASKAVRNTQDIWLDEEDMACIANAKDLIVNKLPEMLKKIRDGFEVVNDWTLNMQRHFDIDKEHIGEQGYHTGIEVDLYENASKEIRSLREYREKLKEYLSDKMYIIKMHVNLSFSRLNDLPTEFSNHRHRLTKPTGQEIVIWTTEESSTNMALDPGACIANAKDLIVNKLPEMLKEIMDGFKVIDDWTLNMQRHFDIYREHRGEQGNHNGIDVDFYENVSHEIRSLREYREKLAEYLSPAMYKMEKVLKNSFDRLNEVPTEFSNHRHQLTKPTGQKIVIGTTEEKRKKEAQERKAAIQKEVEERQAAIQKEVEERYAAQERQAANTTQSATDTPPTANFPFMTY